RLGLAIQVLDDLGGGLGPAGFALHTEAVAVVADVHLQALFQQPVVFVELTAEGGQARGIGRFKMKLLWFVGQEIFSRSADSRRAECWVMDKGTASFHIVRLGPLRC